MTKKGPYLGENKVVVLDTGGGFRITSGMGERVGESSGWYSYKKARLLRDKLTVMLGRARARRRRN